MIKKQNTPAYRPSKRRVTFWIETTVMDQLQEESQARSVSQQNIFETTLKERYSQKRKEDNEALLARRLNKIDSRQKVSERQSDIIAESLALFVRMWLTSTHEIPEDQKDAAVLQGQARYDRYLSSLAKSLKADETIFAALPNEILFKPDDFSK